MPYSFLGLVNDVNGRVNEVPLTSSNFASAEGYYSMAKEAVNSSIRYINQDKFTWPFNYVQQEDVLTAGVVRYPIPNNAKHVDYNTFRVKRNSSFGTTTQKLWQMDYEEFLDKYADSEYNTANTSIRDMPKFIIRGPGNEYLVYPSPDQAYELVYEYYLLPVDLNLYTDVPTIPQAFRHVIIDGAMFYIYSFRGDIENADRSFNRFDMGLKDMRSIYINRFEYIRDTRVQQSNASVYERLT